MTRTDYSEDSPFNPPKMGGLKGAKRKKVIAKTFKEKATSHHSVRISAT